MAITLAKIIGGGAVFAALAWDVGVHNGGPLAAFAMIAAGMVLAQGLADLRR